MRGAVREKAEQASGSRIGTGDCVESKRRGREEEGREGEKEGERGSREGRKNGKEGKER